MPKLSYLSIIILCILLSFCSFTYELLLAKTLGVLTDSAVIIQSLTIGVYILALGLGTMIADRKIIEKPADKLFNIEICLSSMGACCVILTILLNTLKTYYSMTDVLGISTSSDYDYYDKVQMAEQLPFMLFFLTSELITFWVGFFSGFEIPLLIALAKESNHHNKDNEIIGYTSFGTLLATVVFAFILMPIMDVDKSAILVALINFGISIYLYIHFKSIRKLTHKIYLAFNFVIIIFVMIFSPIIYQIDLKSYYYYDTNVLKHPLKEEGFLTFMDNVPDVERIKTLYQYIDIVKPAEKTSSATQMTVFLNRHFQFSIFKENDAYHEGMSHVPVNFFKKVPENILVLGAGDGLLINELLKYGDEVKSITQIELDQEMYKLSINHPILSKTNNKSLLDKKVTTIIQDAFYFVRNTKNKYDAIYIDFPYPHNYDIARLYSTEFFKFVSRIVNEDGYIIMDVPAYNREEITDLPEYAIEELKNGNNIMFSTVASSGMRYGVYDVGSDPFFILYKENKEVDKIFSSPRMFRYYRPGLEKPRQVLIEQYDYEIDDKYVNSIFNPKLLKLGGSSF